MNCHLGSSRRAMLLAGCTVLGLATAHGAFAADAETQQIEEVVVTANKRAENIQDVPAAVTAVSADLLTDAHATQLTDIAAYVPALVVNSGGTPGQTQISIRGIAPIGPGATVATYINDAPVGSSSAYGGGVAFALDLLPYDIQRLEVLRGPQGTLYGASSMGGLLKYVLTEPSLDRFQGRVGADLFGLASAGKAGGSLQAQVSGPLVDGKLGGTASYAVQKTPGFVDNAVTGEKDQDGYTQESARLGLTWEPVDTLSIKLNGLYQHIDADGFSNVALNPATLRPLNGAREDNNLVEEAFKKTIKFASASIEYELPFATFVSSSSYQDTRTSQTRDQSYIWATVFPFVGLPPGKSTGRYKLHLEKYTQEVRLQSKPGTIEWLVGAFYTHEDSSNFQSPDLTNNALVPIPGLSPVFTAQLPSLYKEYAAFGDVTWHVTDAFELTGGVRYSENRQSFSEIASSALLGLVIDIRDRKSHESVTTYNVSAKYHLNDDVMVYGRVASGYQPGGPNLALVGTPPPFNSNTLTNYEAGVKSEFLNRRLLVNVAAFHIKWEDIQLLVSSGGISQGRNGGTAESEGIEANVTLRPAQGLSIDGTFAYVDAKLTENVPEIGALDGDRLPNIPRYSGSLRASYSYPLSGDWAADFGAGLRFQGARYSAADITTRARLPGYTALDLNASVSNDRYTIRLYAKNVTDKHGYVSYDDSTDALTEVVNRRTATVLQPRLVGIGLEARF